MDALKNFAYSTLATPPSGTGGLSLVIATGDGSKFPSAPFNATIWPVSVQPTADNAEIVRVTAKSTDTFTITRAQESTSARTWTAGAQIAQAISKRVLDDLTVTTANVKAYGATGDGATDDTAFVQAAIDAIEALGGGMLYFPPGTYKVTAELTVTQPMVILGAGMGVSLVRATTLGASKGVFKVTSNKVSFRDLTVRGPSVASYVLDECGIWFYGTSGTPLYDGVVENCEVYDVGSWGILYEYANRSSAVRNYVHDVGYAGIANLSSADWLAAENRVDTVTPGTASNAYGLMVNKRLTGETTPTRGTMSKNVVKNVALWEGIDTHGGTFYTINDNVVSGCKIGIQVGPDSFGNVPHFTTIVGNVVDNGALTATQLRGISIGGDGSTNVRGIVCKGNSINTMGGADGSSQLLGAILVQYTLGSVVSGNSIYSAEQNGIVYDGGGNTGIVCTDNAIHGVTLRTGNASGIRFNTATTGVCTGNYIDASDNYPLYFNSACLSLRLDDTNVLITDGTAPASGTTLVGVTLIGRGHVFRGSKTHNFGDLATGAKETTTVTVTGAVLGDKALAWLLIDQANVVLHAYVSASNTVTVVAENLDTGNVNLASTTLYAEVVRA